MKSSYHDTAEYAAVQQTAQSMHNVHEQINSWQVRWLLFTCVFGFYGISTFAGYLMPNPFLYK